MINIPNRKGTLMAAVVIRCVAAWLVFCGVAVGQVYVTTNDESYVYFNSADSFITGEEFSVSSWVTVYSTKNEAYVPSRIITFPRPGSEGTAYAIGFAYGNLAIYIRTEDGTANYTNVFSIETNKEYFVAATYNGTTYKVYVDGEEVFTTNNTFVGIGDTPIFIGAYYHTYAGGFGFADAVLADVRAYNRLLSSNEISEIYHRPWTLHDSWVDDSLVQDESGNGYAAANYGAVLGQDASGYYAEFDSSESDKLEYAGYGVSFTNISVYAEIYRNANSGYDTVIANRGESGEGIRFQIYYNDNTCLWGIYGNDRENCLKCYTVEDISEEKISLCGTWDGGITTNALRFYYDGVERIQEKVEGGTFAGMSTNPHTLKIGSLISPVTTYGFDGTIYTIKIFDEVLSSNDVYTLSTEGTITNKPVVSYDMHPLEQSGSLILRTCINDKWDKGYVEDMSGNGHAATNNGVDLVPCAEGWRGEFLTIESNYLDAGDSDSFSFGDASTDEPFSVIVKATITDTNSQYCFLSKYRAKDNSEYLIRALSNGRLDVSLRDAAGANDDYIKNEVAGLTTTAPAWYAFTYDGSSTAAGILLYVNGLLTEQAPVDGGGYTAMHNTTSPLYIGAAATTSSYMNGSIECAYLFPGELTSNDIHTLSTGGTITNEPIAKWTMRPAYLDTGDTLTGIARNYGSGADGTYSNGPTAAPWRIQVTKPSRDTVNADNSLVAAYLFDSGVNDSSGYINDGTALGGVYFSNNVAYFDGTAAGIALPRTKSLTLTNAMTFSFWMNRPSYSGQAYMIGKINTSSDRRCYGIFSGDSYIYILLYSAGTTSPAKYYMYSSAYSYNTWTHVAVTFGDDELILYVNGSAKVPSNVVVDNSLPWIYSSGLSTYLGSRGDGTTEYKGYLDSVKIYNRVLTPNEIQALFNEGCSE